MCPKKEPRMHIMISSTKFEDDPFSSSESLIGAYYSSENIPSYFDLNSEWKFEDFPSSDDLNYVWEHSRHKFSNYNSLYSFFLPGHVNSSSSSPSNIPLVYPPPRIRPKNPGHSWHH